MKESRNLVVIVPYRDRSANLERLIPVLVRHLRGTPHRLVVVEQSGDDVFNKGRVLNIGFDLYRREGDYFCFHDVDLLPESEECDYSEPERPTHLAMHCSQFDYDIPYAWACGGVLLVSRGDFERVNGYSNEYWGWGAEDDDFAMRLAYAGLVLGHRSGKYTSQPHELGWNQSKLPSAYRRNVERLRSTYDYTQDGLSNLQYRVVSTRDEGTHLHHFVDVGTCPHHGSEASEAPSTSAPQPVDPTVFWSERHRAPLAFSIIRHALNQRAAGRPLVAKRTVPQAVVDLFGGPPKGQSRSD